MDAAKVLELVIGRLGFVERRAERRRRDGLPDAREQQEVATLQWLVGFVGALLSPRRTRSPSHGWRSSSAAGRRPGRQRP